MRGFPLRSFLATALVAIALTSGAIPVLVPTPAFAASAVLDDAQKMYDSAKFEDAIAKVRAGLSTGTLTGSDAINGRALLARCLVKAGKRIEGKEAFKGVLRQDAGFRLDGAVVPPDEMDVFNLAAKEINAEQIEEGNRLVGEFTEVGGPGFLGTETLTPLPKK